MASDVRVNASPERENESIAKESEIAEQVKRKKDVASLTPTFFHSWHELLAKGADIFAIAGFISPVDHAGFFGKDSDKPILREFEKHRLHYPLVHFSSYNEPAITPRLTKAEDVFVIHGTRGK